MYRVLLLGFFVLTGCTLFVEKPEVAVKSVNLAGLDQNGIELDFLLSVTNNNSYRLRLSGYSFNLLVSTLPLAHGENPELIEFAGNATTDVKLPIRVGSNDLLEILKHRPDPDHIPYELKAGFNMETPLGNIFLPVDKTGTFSVPQKYRPDHFLKKLKDIFHKD
jgi:LEA14-like dessication related protein